MNLKEDRDGRRSIFVRQEVLWNDTGSQAQSKEAKRAFITSQLYRFSNEERARCSRWVRDDGHPERKWSKVGRWQEGPFMSDSTLRPRKAVRMVVHYFKANSEMGPLFVKMAQKEEEGEGERSSREELRD